MDYRQGVSPAAVMGAMLAGPVLAALFYGRAAIGVMALSALGSFGGIIVLGVYLVLRMEDRDDFE